MHAGSATCSTEPSAAPSKLATVKSHLSKEFDLLGNTGDWDPRNQQGNPVESLHLRKCIKGYKYHVAEFGYQKRGAVHVLLEEADII